MVRVLDEEGHIVFEHPVGSGDIWRMCQTKDAAIADWVKLGVARARRTNYPAVFWLDEKRAHDAQLIQKGQQALKSTRLPRIWTCVSWRLEKPHDFPCCA